MRLYVEFFRYLSMALPRIEQLYMDMDCRLAIEGIRSEKGKPMKIRVVEEAEVQALSSRYPFDFMN